MLRAGCGVPPQRTLLTGAQATNAALFNRYAVVKVRDGDTPSPTRETRTLPRLPVALPWDRQKRCEDLPQGLSTRFPRDGPL